MLRLGLVGCGRIAERGWVPAIQRVPGLRLAGVVDRDLARCAAVAPGVPAFQDAAALTGVDAVIVATPAASHVDDAAAAGVPALVEKPPAPSAEEARVLAALDPQPFVVFNRRFDPEIRSLRSRISGRKPLKLHLVLHYRRTRWAPIEDSSDALLDLGPHLADLARWLTRSDVEDVRTRVLEDERFRLELKLNHGTALIEGATDCRWREEVVLAGVGRHRRGGLIRLCRDDSLVASLAAELTAFVSAVGGSDPGDLATALDGVAAMEVLDDVRRAACSPS